MKFFRDIDSRDRWGANKNPGHSEENNDVTQLSDISPLALAVLGKTVAIGLSQYCRTLTAVLAKITKI